MEEIQMRKIKIIMGQTNYTEQEAREKLDIHGQNTEIVIREYLGTYKPSETKTFLASNVHTEKFNMFRKKLSIPSETLYKHMK